MQTFLPHPSFADSARALDGPRLGKQRVETLQVLRALVVPTYGWQRHPAVGMWRGRVPALTAYGLAIADEWIARGHADAVRGQLLEFAPEVDGQPQQALAAAGLLPPWLGDAALHESHRSRLIQKAPEVYRPLFPGTPEDLEYVWPAPEEVPAPVVGHGLWVIRVGDLEPWRGAGLLGLPGLDPRGRLTPAWRAQLRSLEDELRPGTPVGVLPDADPRLLHLAEVTGPAAPATLDGVDHVAVAARFEGDLERRSLPVPAALQNPRRLFHLPLVAPIAGPAADPGGSTV